MLNSSIFKKAKKDTDLSKNMDTMAKHAMETMKPYEEKEEKVEKKKGGKEVEIEIEVLLGSTKKKKEK